MAKKEELGKLIYDTHPSYSQFPFKFIMPIIIIGIFFFLIYIFDLFSKFSWLWNIYTIYLFSTLGIIIYLILRGGHRVQIYQKGIFFFDTVKTKKDPYKFLSTGLAYGKQAVTFDDLVAIIPLEAKLSYQEFLGFQIILSKINDEYIVGVISISKKEESKYLKIKAGFKEQMKNHWDQKYIEEKIIL